LHHRGSVRQYAINYLRAVHEFLGHLDRFEFDARPRSEARYDEDLPHIASSLITKVNPAWLPVLGRSLCTFSKPVETPSQALAAKAEVLLLENPPSVHEFLGHLDRFEFDARPRSEARYRIALHHRGSVRQYAINYLRECARTKKQMNE
jgi:hypothetical protein